MADTVPREVEHAQNLVVPDVCPERLRTTAFQILSDLSRLYKSMAIVSVNDKTTCHEVNHPASTATVVPTEVEYLRISLERALAKPLRLYVACFVSIKVHGSWEIVHGQHGQPHVFSHPMPAGH